MNKYELLHYSLAGKTFHMVLNISVVFAVLSMLLSIGLFLWEMISQTASENVLMAQSVIAVLEQKLDVEEMGNRVLEAFGDIPEEIKKDTKSVQYRSYFRELESDPDFQEMEEVLRQFKNAGNVKDIYVVVSGDDNQRMFYVSDPDQSEFRCEIGYYESVSLREIYAMRASTVEHPSRSFFYEDGFIMSTGIATSHTNRCHTAVLVDTSVQHILLKSRQFAVFYILFIAVFTLIFGSMATRRVKKTIVAPLNQLAVTAKSYVEDKRNGDDQGEHFKALKLRTGDEIEILYHVMADMENDLDDYEKNMEEASEEYKRIGTELVQAAAMQRGMLRQVEPDFAGKREYELFASVIQAGDLSSSFYDFFMVDDAHIAILIGEVSQKSVAGACFMAAATASIRTYSVMGGTPAEILSNADRQLSGDSDQGLTASVWFAVIDLETGHGLSCNAGHGAPVIMRGGADFETGEPAKEPPLASGLRVQYTDMEFDLHTGDRIFLYTDGISEAVRKDGERFGTERMLQVLNTYKTTDNETTILLMQDAVKAFAGNTPQPDDMTMLGFTWKGFRNAGQAS